MVYQICTGFFGTANSATLSLNSVLVSWTYHLANLHGVDECNSCYIVLPSTGLTMMANWAHHLRCTSLASSISPQMQDELKEVAPRNSSLYNTFKNRRHSLTHNFITMIL